FDPAVPAPIVGVAVAALLAVGLVVLLVVAHGIVQREAVVGGHEVDARPGAPSALVEEVARSGEAPGELPGHGFVSLPEGTRGIAKAIVPLGPARGEAAHLVAPGTAVPRLGD